MPRTSGGFDGFSKGAATGLRRSIHRARRPGPTARGLRPGCQGDCDLGPGVLRTNRAGPRGLPAHRYPPPTSHEWRSPMNVILAQPRGFCAGVVRAIDIVELALEQYGAPVYVRHEIVHNHHVVESLKAKG